MLDYYGVNYDIVEVNSVTRRQLKWSTDYRKVPLLVAHQPDGADVKVGDSVVIVSALRSLMEDQSQGKERERQCQTIFFFTMTDFTFSSFPVPAVGVLSEGGERGRERQEVGGQHQQVQHHVPGHARGRRRRHRRRAEVAEVGRHPTGPQN